MIIIKATNLNYSAYTYNSIDVTNSNNITIL